MNDASRYQTVQLRYVAKTGTGHTPSRARSDFWIEEDRTIPWMTLADVWRLRDGTIDVVTDTVEKITPLGLANSSAVLHPAGTVLLSRTASVGFAAIMGKQMAVSQDFMTWTPGPLLDGRFLLYVLRGMRPRLLGLMHGSTHKTIYMPDLLALRTPLPRVDQQRAIAHFLDKECERIESLGAAVRSLSRVLEEGWQERLEDTMRSDETRRLRHWGVTVQLGPFGSALKSDEYVTGRVPLINPVHIHWKGLRPAWDVTIAEERAQSLSQWRLGAGDVVLARRGELGRAAVVRTEEAGYLCGTGSAIIRRSPQIDSGFLVLFLLTRAARDQLTLAAAGSTMPNLDTDALLDLPIPICTPRKQVEAVRDAVAHREHVDDTRARVKTLIKCLTEYREALITEAVTGQLDVTRVSEAQMDERAHAAAEGDSAVAKALVATAE